MAFIPCSMLLCAVLWACLLLLARLGHVPVARPFQSALRIENPQWVQDALRSIHTTIQGRGAGGVKRVVSLRGCREVVCNLGCNSNPRGREEGCLEASGAGDDPSTHPPAPPEVICPAQ